MSKDYEDNYKDYSTTKIDNGSGDFLKRILIISGAVIFVLLIIAFVIILTFSGNKTKKPQVEDKTPVATSSGTGHLNLDNEDEGDNSPNTTGTSSDERAESLFFADFYSPKKIDFDYQVSSYGLPIYLKSDVLNFYDVSKKIDLDLYIENLNNNGASIMGNMYSRDANDFYSAYRKINSEQIPMFVTSDFINYYFQNTLKQSFKEVEKSVFYENLWNLAKKFYEISSTRYRHDFAEKGLVNDPVLEGEKMEASYFAVILELLKPISGQVNKKTNFTDEKKFSEQEAEDFNYVLLEYLKNDVLKEVGYIRGGVGVNKSPVFLYEKKYSDYSIPDDYSNNAKLNNFYLVTKWLNSVFPLYFQSEECPDCLLDEEDWRINIVAANLIAKDFEDNQDLKNEWASIYKTISFFRGLRQDLTYLHFSDVFKKVFGEKTIEEIFSRDNDNWESDYIDFREGLLDISFSNLEGSFDRNNPKLFKDIGMRVLQENYWPNDFIFSSLTGDEFTYMKDSNDEKDKFTACEVRGKRVMTTRCSAMGMDIINLVYPLDYNEYFKSNEDYYSFSDAQNVLYDRLSKFDKYSWQNNIYWSTLDTINVFLNSPKSSLPIFMQSDIWKDKDLNTALGSWVNLHLPADAFTLNNSRVVSSLGFSTECNKYNYVEPNLALVNELISKTNMLSDMLVSLRLAEKTNVVSIDLKELGDNLLSLKNIIIKELNNESLEKNDCEYLEEFTSIYKIDKPSDKGFVLQFDTGARNKESIEGLNMLAVVKAFGDDKVILLGPIFNYQESR